MYMLCYICLEKRGDYFLQKINWSLLSDNKIIIDKNILCEYEKNILIKYIEDDHTSNIIDLKNRIYIRENNEFLFKIDFNKKIFYYELKENNICLENIIECELNQNDKNILLKYKIDEEEKKIIIQVL